VVRADWWLLRALDFPRAQLFVLALVAAGALMPFLERPRKRPGSVANLLLVAALGAAVLQGARILPYTPLWPDQVHSAAGAPGPTIRLLVANVLIDNRDRSRLLRQVDRWKPDVVVLTEPDDWWAAAVRPLREDYPHAVEVPLPNAYGMILYSRLPLLDPAVQYLVEPDVPSIRADVEVGGRRVALRLVHPRPPIPSTGTTTERDAELLIAAGACTPRSTRTTPSCAGRSTTSSTPSTSSSSASSDWTTMGRTTFRSSSSSASRRPRPASRSRYPSIPATGRRRRSRSTRHRIGNGGAQRDDAATVRVSEAA
jgi:hypothetical protein